MADVASTLRAWSATAGSNSPSGSLRSGSTTNTGSTGGSANLAAGLKVLKCVKYQ